MTTIAKSQAELIVPANLQRRAGIKPGDKLKFRVAPRMITITVEPPSTYKPTKAELAAIRKGRAEIRRGESVTLQQLLNDLDTHPRKASGKRVRKSSG